MRNLILIFGDQLDLELSALRDYDPLQDQIAMGEVEAEALQPAGHKTRLAFFFSAMRHFRFELLERGMRVHYHSLTPDRSEDRGRTVGELLQLWIGQLQPRRVVLTEPGSWAVRCEIEATCRQLGVPLEIRPDEHFYCSLDFFREWAGDRKSLVLEHFYRLLRKINRVLVDDALQPLGGAWNFDRANRGSFGKKGPGRVPPPPRFGVDPITTGVCDLIAQRFPMHPGSLDDFAYPVTQAQAREALSEFIVHRLPLFGRFQDAMWTGEDVLFHSQLSPVLNAHLLNPRQVIGAAVSAYEAGQAPLESVEAFVRQILGWREFVRGVYWTFMPQYAERNELGCIDRPIPAPFWTGETPLNCVHQAMQGVLRHAYAHHIQRLMVLGLYAQLVGVHPYRFHQWHLAMFVDALDWASLPNVLGMSQFGDGGLVGTKPYCASGNYVHRMSDYCRDCRFDPRQAVGERACPLTTLYWDFLARHREQLQSNRRMTLQLQQLANKPPAELSQIQSAAALHRRALWGDAAPN